MHARALVVAFLVAVAASEAGAADRFVSMQGDDAANDCLTSSAPCRSITHGLAAASSGDVVKVANGRYDESPGVVASKVVTISGSWTPDFVSRDAASRGSKVRGLLGVFAGAGVTIDVTVDGFLITGNGGVVASASGDGASTVRLVSTGVDFNRLYPGILASAYNTSTVDIETTDTSVSLNRVLYDNAAVHLISDGSAALTLTMTDSVVERNLPSSQIAGIRAAAASLSTIDVVLTRTRVDRNRGAGIAVGTPAGGSVNVTLIDSSVSRNGFGGVFSNGANVSITNTVIARNRVQGVEMFEDEPNTLQIVNSTIKGNRAFCTVGPQCAAGVYVGPSSTADLLNTIVWGNRARGGAADVAIAGGATVDIDHSDIGELAGAYNDLGGNIDADPLCVSRRDVHLTASSPAIGAGTCAGAPTADFEGDARPTGAGCDMGADEYVP